MYNETVLEHFSNPHNSGEILDPDGVGQTGNPADGDNIYIYIKVKNNRLEKVQFKTFGCGAAIAASSMITVLATGKTLEDGMKITNEDVAEALGGLPPQKLICSNIAADALKNAINEYLSKNIDNTYISVDTIGSCTNSSTDIHSNLLEKQQIQRYLRHIIIPEISGPGQKKLIESSVLVCAPSIDACDMMLLYMAASGIGHIYCYLENTERNDVVLEHIKDLNPEINIEVFDEIDSMESILSCNDYRSHFNIIIGDLEFINKINYSLLLLSQIFIPTLFVAGHSRYGYLFSCSDKGSFQSFISDIKKHWISYEAYERSSYEALGKMLTYSFLGPLATIETIKSLLGIGKVLNHTLHFNLWDMSFGEVEDVKYNDSNASLDIKKLLANKSALVVGTGGLGSPVALTLAKAGIGTIGLVDFDQVELSNLNRQILHSTSKIGMPKVESAKMFLNSHYPDVNVEVYQTEFTSSNANELVKNYDFIVDGLDNLPTRYILNDACYLNKKPYITAGVLTFYGQTTTIIPDESPCYRCIFPEVVDTDSVPSCSERGVLGPVPGLLGVLEAIQVIITVLEMDSPLKGKMLLYNALETDFSVIEIGRNDECQLCGKTP